MNSIPITTSRLSDDHIPPPDLEGIISPLLRALPSATVSTEPLPTVFPVLSPVLRQRVQLLASASSQGWFRLLSYDPAAVPKLVQVAQSGDLELHPVSGEVEVDWEAEAQTQYRRVDQETLQALVTVDRLGLAFRLVYCHQDRHEGAGKGGGGGGSGSGNGDWRVGELCHPRQASLASFGTAPTVEAAERAFESESRANRDSNHTTGRPLCTSTEDDDDDDGDNYWARYDVTPAHTPAVKRSPAPVTSAAAPKLSQPSPPPSDESEDNYFSQYDHVQPAMDNHDPDEEPVDGPDIQSLLPLGMPRIIADHREGPLAEEKNDRANVKPDDETRLPRLPNQQIEYNLAQPRPSSSASSNNSHIVARLEGSAMRRDQSEFGVRQHISRSIRSLSLLSRAAGIDQEEFERLVKTELDVLRMMEDDI